MEELNRIKPVWVELGLQTVHEDTAAFLRRGYPLSVYEEAVRGLRKRGIEVITHVILGLPGENTERMFPSLEEYTRWILSCTEILRPDLVIHRLTGDGPGALLLAPLWTRSKRHVLNTIHQAFREQNTWQGKYYSG